MIGMVWLVSIPLVGPLAYRRNTPPGGNLWRKLVNGETAHALFTLRLLGYGRVHNYDGSWQEWGNRPDLPLAR
jgi:hypothetical protein